MKTDFLKPRLDGVRFVEHSIPLEVLKDWAAFEELVLEMARSLYLKENTERKRVPRGFADNFSLHLSGVENGSAKPVIQRMLPDGELPGINDIFERARDIVLLTITAAALNQPFPEEFPKHLLGYFDQFGRSLRDGEKIEFVVDGQSAPVVYDRSTRKRLVLTAANEYRATAELRGWISEVNSEKRSYTLKLVNGERIQAVFASELRKIVLEALDQFETSKVLVKGIAVFDQSDRTKKIEQTTHIELLDANDVPARLEELTLLKDGWLDGKGKAPAKTGIKWLSDAWMKSYPDGLPDPFTYPTAEGGIQLEWTLDRWELSAEINLTDHQAALVGVNIDNNKNFDATADLNTQVGWKALSDMVNTRLNASLPDNEC